MVLSPLQIRTLRLRDDILIYPRSPQANALYLANRLGHSDKPAGPRQNSVTHEAHR
jgi:hypothetical protein